MVYLITYDLHKVGRDYRPVDELLTRAGAIHPMGSVWLIDTNSSSGQLRDALKVVVDGNDEVFVTRLAPQDWASYNFDQSAVAWLNAPRNW